MNYLNLSKEVSYALRHAPWEYELELDAEGWVTIEQLLSALKQSDKWRDITEVDILKMIEISDKKRHEISSGKIRAFYGHSVPMKISKEIGYPPKYLYHGTSVHSLESIQNNGIKPMVRQYVHLSEDIETAKLVGNRKSGKTVILKINTEAAQIKGINFYIGNEKVWLADYIPFEFIEITEA